MLKKNCLVLFVPDNKLQEQANCKDRKDYSFVQNYNVCLYNAKAFSVLSNDKILCVNILQNMQEHL